MPSLLSKLGAGDTVIGTWLTLGSAAVAEAVSHCGLDWVVIDCEHAPNDPRDVAEQLRAVDAAGAAGSRTEAVVRVAANDPVQIKRVMDVGASAVLIPNITSSAEAAAAVAAMQYPLPGGQGRRGVAGLVRAGRYGLDNEYVRASNDRILPILQIESAEGVRNVEAILSTPGIGAILIGPSDLAASLGHLGQPWNDDVVGAIRRVITAARAARIPVGIFAADASEAVEYRSWGVTMLGLHSDVRWLTEGIIRQAAALRE